MRPVKMFYNESIAARSCSRRVLERGETMKRLIALALLVAMLVAASSALALTENTAYNFAKDVIKDCIPQAYNFRFLSDDLIIWPDGDLWAVYGDVTYTYNGSRWQEPYAVFFYDMGRSGKEVLMATLSEEIVYGDAQTCYDAGWRDPEILDTIEYYYYAQPGNEYYVWISPYGSTYHSRSDCSSMRDPQYVEATNDVLRQYRPCSKCWGY